MICIELYEGRWCDAHDELPQSIGATLQGIALRFWEHCRVYAEDGSVWRPEPLGIPALSSFRLARWMLVDTGFYNPVRAVPMRYKAVGDFMLTDLKLKILDAASAVLDEYFYFPDDCPEDRSMIEDIGRRVDRLRGADSFLELSRALRSLLSLVQARSPIVMRSPGINPVSLLPPYW